MESTKSLQINLQQKSNQVGFQRFQPSSAMQGCVTIIICCRYICTDLVNKETVQNAAVQLVLISKSQSRCFQQMLNDSCHWISIYLD